MASLVRFTPIVGAYQDRAPACYLLEIDSQKLLLDCGVLPADGNGCFRVDEAYLKALKRTAKTVDAVLLSHGDLEHCGALPLIIESLPPEAPIYATIPVHHMGLMTLYDCLQSLEPFSPTLPFSYDQVDAAFDRIQRVRYSQPITLKSSSSACSLLALPAGHSIGGSMWRIRKAPAEDVLYSPAFNHKKEAHLEGALFDAITRPSVMIVGAQQALSAVITRKDRDASLFSVLQSTLRAGGSALLPCDAGSRVLELALVLDQGWSELIRGLAVPPRAFLLTHQAYRSMEFAKGMLEWMSQSVMKCFDTDRTNPFDFKHLRLVHSLEELPSSASTPMIVLATSEYLDYGLSHGLLPVFCKHSASCIIGTGEALPGSLLSRLMNPDCREVRVKLWSKVPLEGDELAQHLAAQREAEERKAADLAFAAYERARRDMEFLETDEPGAITESLTAAVSGEGNEENFSELLERQIENVESFRNIFWVDYRNDWNVGEGPQLMEMLAKAPELLSDVYMSLGSSAQQRFQCFPARDVIRSVNEYGEVVSPGEFERSGNEVKEDINNKQAGKKKDEQAESVGKKQVPFKWVATEQSLAVRCARKFVAGFGGLSDGRSVKTIISRINPRKLVLIGGSLEATEFLLGHYSTSATQSIEAFAPKIGEVVNVSSAMNLISIGLADSLLNGLRVSTFQDYEIAHLLGRIKNVIDIGNDEEDGEDVDASGEDDVEMTDAAEKSGKSETFEIVPAALEDLPPCPSIIVGDLKLSELRRYIGLKYASMSTEFTASGDLICGGRVLVRRDQQSGHISVEGPLCREYYQVRTSLYENVTMV